MVYTFENITARKAFEQINLQIRDILSILW